MLVLLIAAPAAVSAIEQYDYVTYYVLSNETVTVGWDAVDNADTYEIQLLRFEWGNEVVWEMTSITDTQVDLVIPKSGMYSVRVRARNEAGVSDWAISTDPVYASVGGEPREWWVYRYLAPPPQVVMEGGP